MNKIAIRIKYFINEYKRKIWFALKKEKMDIGNNSKKVYIFLAADYGNIGDIAITYAQKKYIEEVLPDYQVIEVPLKQTNRILPFLKKKITAKDIVTIVGGGNMTNRYDSIEEARRMVIKTFKKNRIISFPQTIEFTDDILGQESKRRSQKIYENHPDLVIFARENKSYDKMQKTFPKNKVLLVPDIVISLNKKLKNKQKNRNKIGICLRNDKEKLIQYDVLKEIEKNYGKTEIEQLSTCRKEEDFNYHERYEIFFDLLDKIREKEVFVTDRLHGMIFCYLTNTPCIALDNDNHKIRESYKKWFKDYNYIKLIEDFTESQLEWKRIIENISKIETLKEKEIQEEFSLIEEYLKMEK